MILVLLLACQMYDFDSLYNTATTLLVQFQEEQKMAFDTLVELARDSAYADTALVFLVDRFDTKSAIERHRLKDIFKAIGPAAIPAIVRRIDHRGSDAEDRHLSQSLWVLGEIGGDSIVEPVSGFVHDNNWHIRSSAFTALGKSKSVRARDFIVSGLHDTIDPVRKSAYYALSEIASLPDIPYLKIGIEDPFYGVRYAALKGLVALDSAAHTALVDIAETSEQGMFYAVLGLCSIDHIDEALNNLTPSASAYVRFQVYNACDDIVRLRELLEQEEETILENCIRRTIKDLEKKSAE